MLLASHDFVDESWMGTPVDFPGIGERDTNLPSIRCSVKNSSMPSSIYISFVDLPAPLGFRYIWHRFGSLLQVGLREVGRRGDISILPLA